HSRGLLGDAARESPGESQAGTGRTGTAAGAAGREATERPGRSGAPGEVRMAPRVGDRRPRRDRRSGRRAAGATAAPSDPRPRKRRRDEGGGDRGARLRARRSSARRGGGRMRNRIVSRAVKVGLTVTGAVGIALFASSGLRLIFLDVYLLAMGGVFLLALVRT